ANSINATLEYLELPKRDLLIQIQSSIPPGKGLGSSASVAIAVVKSLFAYADTAYTEEDLLQFANIAETYAHGAPSGIDTLTITSQSPDWYEQENPTLFIEQKDNFDLIVADSGRVGDTRSADVAVANLFIAAPKNIQKKLERIGELTHRAKDALEK